MSPRSLYFRFLGIPGPSLAKQIAAMCAADGRSQVVLVAESGDRIAAIAGYYVDAQRPHRAEVAFTVDDALQGQGLGTRMLERLAELARERGIVEFVADVHSENRKMLDVFRDCGFTIGQHVEQGVAQIVIDLAVTPAFQERSATRSERAAAASMRRLFEPRSVAVVGASRRRGRIGSEIFHSLLKYRFQGPVYAVNPHARRVGGRPSYATLREVPGPVDLAVIVVPAAAVPAAVEDAIAHGVSGLVVISAGFRETGVEGARREAALVDAVRRAGIRMVGPNCMGIANTDPRFRLNATFAPVSPPAGRVALASQSGALGIALLETARRRHLGISTFVSLGNKADVSGNDLVQYWSQDPRTDVILLYLESFGLPGAFARLARRVGHRKPIVAVKAGRSRAGARAASSHTGALAESDAVVEALFRQAGVIRTRTLEELFDVAALLASQPLPTGRRVAILTNAGGPAILAADACEAQALELAVLDPGTRARLAALLPREAGLGNPVDMLASASAEQYGRALDLLLADANVDAVLVIFIPPIVTGAKEVASAIARVALHSSKTVIANFLTDEDAPAALRRIPSYPFPERAIAALSHAANYAAWKRRPAGRAPTFPTASKDQARATIQAVLERGGGWLSPPEIEKLLAAYSIPIAPARLVRGEDEAVGAAKTLGFPVVLKAVGPSIIHKTEAGAVHLNLETDEGVRRAFRELRSRLGVSMTEALVQRQIEGGVEVIVGATLDPTFGPLILYGSGGTLVELLGDVTFRLPPVTGVDAEAMLDEVRGTQRLRGWRGTPRADEPALREMLTRVSALVEAVPEIRELDFNPVVVLPRGVAVLDARVRVERRSPAPPSRRIAY
jgi:acetyl coenzyme A synthetase (ADP forming)-like protein